MSARDRVARRLADKPTAAREELGTAVSESSGGHVEVQIGDRVWTVTDHPKRLTRSGDVVVVRTSGNTRKIAENQTFDANPPSTMAPPSASASTSSASGGWSTRVSSGTYDADSGNAFLYARDNAATTRALAGDINELRDKSNLNEAGVEALKTSYNDLTTKYNALKTSYDQLWAALKSQGLIS